MRFSFLPKTDFCDHMRRGVSQRLLMHDVTKEPHVLKFASRRTPTPREVVTLRVSKQNVKDVTYRVRTMSGGSLVARYHIEDETAEAFEESGGHMSEHDPRAPRLHERLARIVHVVETTASEAHWKLGK